LNIGLALALRQVLVALVESLGAVFPLEPLSRIPSVFFVLALIQIVSDICERVFQILQFVIEVSAVEFRFFLIRKFFLIEIMVSRRVTPNSFNISVGELVILDV
jgi:hypothetical protein